MIAIFSPNFVVLLLDFTLIFLKSWFITYIYVKKEKKRKVTHML